MLYGKKQVGPGETAFAQLRLSEPALLLPGDRFIIRQFSPVITSGGGVVVENTPPKKVKDAADYARFLKMLSEESQVWHFAHPRVCKRRKGAEHRGSGGAHRLACTGDCFPRLAEPGDCPHW